MKKYLDVFVDNFHILDGKLYIKISVEHVGKSSKGKWINYDGVYNDLKTVEEKIK